jgi:hypothetical protein
MTLLELQEVLGERIKIAVDNTVPIEDRLKETELSQTISSLAKQMINNADIVLRTDRLIADGKAAGSNIIKLVNGDGKQR